MSIVHGPGPRASGAGAALRIVTVVLAGLAVAGAVVVVVLPLPKPAAGGTCGPGAGSEPAIAAFFDPVSIGAGPPPTSSAVEAYQWQAFVGQCQASANGRMVDGLALLLVAALFGLVLHPLVRRAWHEPVPAGPAAGWHEPIPAGPAAGWHEPVPAGPAAGWHGEPAPSRPWAPPTPEAPAPPPPAEHAPPPGPAPDA